MNDSLIISFDRLQETLLLTRQMKLILSNICFFILFDLKEFYFAMTVL